VDVPVFTPGGVISSFRNDQRGDLIVYVSVVELNGRDNPILKTKAGIVEDVYRVRLRETGDTKVSITVTTDDIDVLEDLFPGITASSRFEVSFEKMEIGRQDEE
jgi:hypothetical protein